MQVQAIHGKPPEEEQYRFDTRAVPDNRYPVESGAHAPVQDCGRHAERQKFRDEPCGCPGEETTGRALQGQKWQKVQSGHSNAKSGSDERRDKAMDKEVVSEQSLDS